MPTISERQSLIEKVLLAGEVDMFQHLRNELAGGMAYLPLSPRHLPPTPRHLPTQLLIRCHMRSPSVHSFTWSSTTSS
jgi:hypothetical protein